MGNLQLWLTGNESTSRNGIDNETIKGLKKIMI